MKRLVSFFIADKVKNHVSQQNHTGMVSKVHAFIIGYNSLAIIVSIYQYIVPKRICKSLKIILNIVQCTLSVGILYIFIYLEISGEQVCQLLQPEVQSTGIIVIIIQFHSICYLCTPLRVTGYFFKRKVVRVLAFSQRQAYLHSSKPF